MSKVFTAVGNLIGLALAMAAEALIFALVASLPLAALVVIGVIGQPLAMTLLGVAAALGALESLLLTIIKALL